MDICSCTDLPCRQKHCCRSLAPTGPLVENAVREFVAGAYGNFVLGRTENSAEFLRKFSVCLKTKLPPTLERIPELLFLAVHGGRKASGGGVDPGGTAAFFWGTMGGNPSPGPVGGLKFRDAPSLFDL